MWLFSEDSIEIVRTMPMPYWVLLSFLCLGTHIGSVCGVHDFTVYRMQHFDLHGSQLGSRSALVNMDARSVGSVMLNRKCVLVRWTDLSIEVFTDVLQRGAGAVLILLPTDWGVFDKGMIATWVELESELLSLSDIKVPVYFVYESEEILNIYHQVAYSGLDDKNSSAVSAILSAIAGEGYSIVADTADAKVLDSYEVVTLTGKLSGGSYEQDLPTIAIITHYDSFGLVPSLTSCGDNSGSGVSALVELARLFSLLYSNPQYHPKYNLLFVVTGGGTLNYFGTKYFIEDMVEDADSFLLTDADYTLCLDALAGSSKMYLHVSRPPKEGTKGEKLVKIMNQTVDLIPGYSVALTHKKIRMADELLAWEHERFSFHKMPAATLSHFQKHTDSRRKSMFHKSINVENLQKNVQLIAETVGRHILGFDDNFTSLIFSGHMSVRSDLLSNWIAKLSTVSCSPQLVGKESALLLSLEQTLSRYVHEVTKFNHKPDKSDPEFKMYSVTETVIHAYSIKPAIFDLFLAVGIFLYVAVIYLLLVKFAVLQESMISTLLINKKRKKN